MQTRTAHAVCRQTVNSIVRYMQDRRDDLAYDRREFEPNYEQDE